VYGCVRVYVGRVGYVCELVSVDVLGMSGCVDKLVMCVCVCVLGWVRYLCMPMCVCVCVGL